MRVIALLLMLIFLSACSSVFIETKRDSDGNKVKQWTGSVPPLYWAWDHHKKLIFPLAYWDKNKIYTPIYGHNSLENSTYYLTPFIASDSNDGVSSFQVFPFKVRAIDLKEQPTAKYPYDFSLWPVFSFTQPTETKEILSEKYAFIAPPIVSLYEYEKQSKGSNLYECNKQSKDSSLYKMQRYGFLYGNLELCFAHEFEAAAIDNIKKESFTYKGKTISSVDLSYFIPLYISANIDKIYQIENVDYVSKTNTRVFFPFWFETQTVGKTPAFDAISKEISIDSVDMRAYALFPFYSKRVEKGYEYLMTIFYTYIQKKSVEKQYASHRVLWFFSYKTLKKDWELELFFIPIVSFDKTVN